MAAQLAEMLEELGTRPVHVVGLSMGGVIAQQFARDFPHLTKKLVLVSTFAVLRPENFSGWWYFLRRASTILTRGLEAQAHIVAERVFPGPDYASLREMLVETISRADPRAYRAAMRSLGLFDSRKWLPRLQVQTLIVTGTDDTTVTPARQQVLVECIPGARQLVIPQAGHAAPIDQAEIFNRALVEFLQV